MDTNLRAKIFGMAAAALGVSACGGAPAPQANTLPPSAPAATPGVVEAKPGDGTEAKAHEGSCAANASCGAKAGAASCGAKTSGEKTNDEKTGDEKTVDAPSAPEAPASASATPAPKPAAKTTKPGAKPAGKAATKKPAEMSCGAGSCSGKKK